MGVQPLSSPLKWSCFPTLFQPENNRLRTQLAWKYVKQSVKAGEGIGFTIQSIHYQIIKVSGEGVNIKLWKLTFG